MTSPAHLVLRVALCGLLVGCVVVAGCSGSPSASASERAICKTVRAQLDKLPHGSAVPPYDFSEANHLLPSGTSLNTIAFGVGANSIIFVRSNFARTLISSHDPAFERVGRAFQHSGDPALVTQLDARCSTLEL